MSKAKAERHLAYGDLSMKGQLMTIGDTGISNGTPEAAFYLYNSALGNYQKINDIDGQRIALKRMLAAAEAWGNREMVANCKKWLKELDDL